ncbi:hypothetical protein DFH07DRAFT_175822 [Mycena maculata]|uniref:DUF6697 domain-containing protein n=1 Tax=Mycena maculata TaxID=230809 RepID=A0AAD7MSI9_9AGAR|nr:hypothetical protein DFH07DRAFT_175822 [Mycena maculata]
MAALATPSGRPTFDSLKPIDTTPSETFTQRLAATSGTLFFPKRTVWCSAQRVHALVFEPTHKYCYLTNTWIKQTEMNLRCGGETFELFVTQGHSIYYAGTYVVHSLRTIHRTEFKTIPDVSKMAIYHATGLRPNEMEKVKQRFPDGEVKAECFGLQCVGFSNELYEGLLRDRCTGGGGGGDASNKRKAEAEDLLGDHEAKSQRIS